MGQLFISVAPVLPAERIETLFADLEKTFSQAGNAEYLHGLWGSSEHPVPRRITAARLSALSLLPSLLEAVGIPSDRVLLSRDEHGRPRGRVLANSKISFDFNLSHANAHVACGLLTDSGQIGVDVEERLTPDRAMPLIRRFCTDGETRMLGSLSDEQKAVAFTRMWTIREAVSKQEGRGMPLRYDASNLPESVQIFCGRISDTGTQIALCVPKSAAVLKPIESANCLPIFWES